MASDPNHTRVDVKPLDHAPRTMGRALQTREPQASRDQEAQDEQQQEGGKHPPQPALDFVSSACAGLY